MPVKPPTWTPTNRAYHADREKWSSSMFSLATKDPNEAYKRFKLGMPDDRPRGAHLDIGTAIGYSLLEPRLEEEIYLLDIKGRKTKAYQAAAQEHEIILCTEEAEAWRAAVRAVKEAQTPAAETVRALLGAEGWPEYAHAWTCPETGLQLKSKIDKLTPTPWVIELKTCHAFEPRKFARQAKYDFGYARQAAHNLTAVADLLGWSVGEDISTREGTEEVELQDAKLRELSELSDEDCPSYSAGREVKTLDLLASIPFFFVIVETRYSTYGYTPGRHGIHYRKLSAETLELGINQLFTARRRAAHLLQTDSPWLPEWEELADNEHPEI